MKKIGLGLLTLLAALFMCQPVSAQSPAISASYTNEQVDRMLQDFKVNYSHDVVPSQALLQKFMRDFPGARDVEWETAANIYEVEFEIRRDDYKAYYDEQGNLIMYIHDAYQSDLPAAVTNKIRAEYPNYRFSEVERIVKGTETLYKVEVERGDMEVKYVIKSDGTVINKMIDY